MGNNDSKRVIKQKDSGAIEASSDQNPKEIEDWRHYETLSADEECASILAFMDETWKEMLKDLDRKERESEISKAKVPS